MSQGNRMAGGHIVVVGQWREGHGRAPTAYVESVRAAGGVPEIHSVFDLPDHQIPDGVGFRENVDPTDDSALDGAVGLLLPGGGDIDPALYGQSRHERTHSISEDRDTYERTVLDAALDMDLPVLAICHGMQMLNVHLGGTLEQHLLDNPTRIDHDRGYPSPEPIHGVRVKERTLLADLLGTKVDVNSHHHQGLDRLGDGIEEAAWSDDGVLEGVIATDYTWVVGVQWHPEVMAAEDESQANLFTAFVEATRAYAQRNRAAS